MRTLTKKKKPKEKKREKVIHFRKSQDIPRAELRARNGSMLRAVRANTPPLYPYTTPPIAFYDHRYKYSMFDSEFVLEKNGRGRFPTVYVTLRRNTSVGVKAASLCMFNAHTYM